MQLSQKTGFFHKERLFAYGWDIICRESCKSARNVGNILEKRLKVLYKNEHA